MIHFKEVSKSFGSRKILEKISFRVNMGEILFILGKSGMGKSVTLKQIVGLMKPDSGEIWVDDQEVTRLKGEALASIRQKCGMVFQHPALLDSLSVFENVAFGIKASQSEKHSEAELKKRVTEKLSLVQLGPELLDRMPPELSYGMQKRVSLARTLAPGPKVLLFDEPTTGLDPITTNAINDLILSLSRQLKVTSVVVSHDMAGALRIADRIIVLNDGKILAEGTPSEIRKLTEPLIQDFLAETLSLSAPEPLYEECPE